MNAKIRTNDEAVIFYGTGDSINGRVAKIVTSRTGRLRRVGITPEGTDVVAWFSPHPDYTGYLSTSGTTIAYL